ncbi:hypothetical protein DXG03_007935 [Asterophora parasitica]|uniref:AB hydrolase-1 domain-containing protein n=1 Tax=Asterophora parasitica TaxID=117018 RepID=A0A9P7GCW9_9AGAR|nr:hypothetical protein DXG03_007935 [Asterophora parasitica]
MSIDWRREDAADDLAAFMDALNLPPCHVVGISMGSCIALQTAVSYPDKVLSLFLISPLPLEEPREVREGRQEIYDCWVQGWRNYPDVDVTAFKDAMIGANQLAYNNIHTPLSDALTPSPCIRLAEYNIPRAMRNYNRDRLEEYHTASVKFFADRAQHSLEKLRGLKCPVELVHCDGDVAYPIAFAQELLERLLDAGVDAELDVVEGAPHFGTVTHFTERVSVSLIYGASACTLTACVFFPDSIREYMTLSSPTR